MGAAPRDPHTADGAVAAVSFPAGIGTCTVTADYVDGSGNPLTGQIVFAYPGYQLIDGTDKVIVSAGTVTAILVNGRISVVLPFTDNAAVVPSGWSYMVTEQIPFGTSYFLSLPTSTGPTADLANLVRTPNPTYPVFPTAPFVALSAYVAKGDMLVGTGAGTLVRVPVGTNGQVWTANSGASAGANWAPGGGGGGTLPTVRQTYFEGGNITLGADAAWTLYPAITLAIPASVGDWVELVASGMWQPGSGFLDLAVAVSGLAARYSSSGTATPAVEGDPALYPGLGYVKGTALFAFQVTNNDLDNGSVHFTVAHHGGGGAETLYASAQYPWRMRALNLHTVT